MIVLDMVGPLFERQLSLTDAYVSSTNDIPLAVDISPILGKKIYGRRLHVVLKRVCNNKVGSGTRVRCMRNFPYESVQIPITG